LDQGPDPAGETVSNVLVTRRTLSTWKSRYDKALIRISQLEQANSNITQRLNSEEGTCCRQHKMIEDKVANLQAANNTIEIQQKMIRSAAHRIIHLERALSHIMQAQGLIELQEGSRNGEG